MTPEERHQSVRHMYLRARDTPAGERERLIDEIAGADHELKRAVLSLLASEGDDFLSGAALGRAVLPKIDTHPVEVEGKKIGSYTLVRVLGSGGFGVVYLARQANPDREVALKVLHGAAAVPGVRERFLGEAQLLGRLKHPGIAQIHEAGFFDDGLGSRPYLAMEYVQGKTITAYASDGALGIAGRLSLIVKVCEAVRHAHQKGVIHRDLKPDNVLVDEVGQSKILDFGVGRLVEADTASGVDEPARTQAGQMIGTVPYMSPEQAGGNPAEIDTRTDVYSLGVLAYELVTGRLPHDLSGKTTFEAIRIVREVPPVPPGSISRECRGDLGIVLIRALERDKDRRYQSASEFSDDIERVLRHEPVRARPHRAMYLAERFVRRHRVGVAAGAVIVVACLAGAAIVVNERARAAATEERAQSLAGLITTAFRGIDASLGMDGATQTMLIGMLDEAAAELMRGWTGRPQVESELRTALGSAYRRVARYDAAESHLAVALAIRERHLGPQHAQTLETLAELGRLAFTKGDDEQAIAKFERVLATTHARDGELDPERLVLLDDLAGCYWRTGRRDEAADTWNQAYSGLLRIAGPDDPRTLVSLSNLGYLHNNTGKPQAAHDVYAQVLAARRRILGDAHPETIVSMSNLGAVCRTLDRLDEAAALFEEARDLADVMLVPTHETRLTVLNGLAAVRRDQGRFDEAAALFRALSAAQSKVFGEYDVRTLSTLNNLAATYKSSGQIAEALEVYQRIIAAAPKDSLLLGVALTGSGLCRSELGEIPLALDDLHRSEAILSALPKQAEAWHIRSIDALIHAYEKAGDVASVDAWRARKPKG